MIDIDFEGKLDRVYRNKNNMPGGEITKGWVIYFVVGKVKPYHLTFVIVKCHAKGVFSVEGFPFRNMNRLTVEERVKIIKCHLT